MSINKIKAVLNVSYDIVSTDYNITCSDNCVNINNVIQVPDSKNERGSSNSCSSVKNEDVVSVSS